jgi:hypothetical protein
MTGQNCPLPEKAKEMETVKNRQRSSMSDFYRHRPGLWIGRGGN